MKRRSQKQERGKANSPYTKFGKAPFDYKPMYRRIIDGPSTEFSEYIKKMRKDNA